MSETLEETPARPEMVYNIMREGDGSDWLQKEARIVRIGACDDGSGQNRHHKHSHLHQVLAPLGGRHVSHRGAFDAAGPLHAGYDGRAADRALLAGGPAVVAGFREEIGTRDRKLGMSELS